MIDSDFRQNDKRNVIRFATAGVKNGFTLAEVLITLGIIGVVAAITIPNLITAYTLKVNSVALRKKYSQIQNAINLIVEDYGYGACYTYHAPGYYDAVSTDCLDLKKKLIEMLKIQEYKTEVNKKYALRETVRAKGGIATNWGCSYDYFAHIAEPYISMDGTLLWMFKDKHPFLIIDVNNEKGPNKWGYDVFFMTLSNINNKLMLTDEYCSMIEKGGLYPRTIIRSQKANSSNFNVNW